MTRSKRLWSASPIALLSLCVSGIAHAQTATESEVVVTASRTGKTTLQNTPLAVTAFSAEKLVDNGLLDVRDLAGYVPNTSISRTTVFAQIFIRGIGSTNVYGGSDPSVALNVDNVYIGRSFAQFADFLDVERVEVLRGPQGTLYGRNAVGGAINIISRRPSDDFEAQARLTAGNYGRIQTQAFVSGPIADKWSGSLSGSYLSHDAYIKNIVPTGNDIFDANRGSVRAQLKYEPSDKFSAITRADYGGADEATLSYSKLLAPFEPVSNSILGDYSRVALNRTNWHKLGAGGIAEEVNFKASPNWEVRGVLAYRANDAKTEVDSDDTALDVTMVHQEEKQNQSSAELSVLGHVGRFDIVSGVYYFDENVKTNVFVKVFGAGQIRGFTPRSTTEASAVFAQATYNVTPKLAFTAGARYTHEDRGFDQHVEGVVIATGAAAFPTITYQRDAKFDALTPRVLAEWRPNSNLMVYASATRGFKSGGFNFSATASALAQFRPEKVWSYEIGERSTLMDGRLTLNLTGFWYDYTDLQQFIATAPGVANIQNAAAADVQGVELESQLRPTSNVDIGLSASYLDATYKSYKGAPLPQPLGGAPVDATGKRLNNAPKFSGSAFVELRKPMSSGELFVRPDIVWFSRQYYEPTNYILQSQGAYELINLSLGYRAKDNWEAALWGRNLADTQYLTATASNGATFSGQPGEPLTYGVRLSKSW
jgi:iron complex outermembrane receptor protein